MKKTVSLILSLIFVFTILTGCTGDTSSAESSLAPVTEAIDGEVRYGFNPHVYSGIYDDNFDDKTRETFFGFCDAVLAGDEEFPCSDEIMYFNIVNTISHNCMPLATYFVCDTDDPVSHGVGRIEYSMPHDEYLQKVSEFKEAVTDILNEVFTYGMSEEERAKALYSYFETNYTYDYDALGITNDTNLSSYRLLTEHKGICQEIAPLFAYLLLQTGMDCTTCGALNEANESHEWVVAKIDGEYYHIDPTFVMTDQGTWKYFGMTDDKRFEEGGWLKAYFNYGEANIFDSRGDYACTSTRFETLWNQM